MIYCTISTKDRFWNFALTMLCLANAERPAGLYVEVYDDASGELQPARADLLADLVVRDIVQNVTWQRPGRGYNAAFDAFLQRLAGDATITHWLHLDDDLCFSADTLVRLVADYDRWLARGCLYGFVNAWQNFLRGHCNGPLWKVRELGGCAFVMSRATALTIRDVFATAAGRAGRHEEMWAVLRRERETLACNRDEPYLMQHTANAESMLHGRQEGWRDAWSRDLRTGELIDVPPYGVTELRAAVDAGQLEQFVRDANERAAVPVTLPAA